MKIKYQQKLTNPVFLPVVDNPCYLQSTWFTTQTRIQIQTAVNGRHCGWRATENTPTYRDYSQAPPIISRSRPEIGMATVLSPELWSTLHQVCDCGI